MPRAKKSSVSDQMSRRKKRKPKQDKTVSGQLLLSCGSTLFDLALSGRVEGGIPMGKIINIIGDSHAGKSFLALCILAEAASDPRFDDYDLYYDDIESADEFDKEEMFGRKIASRILPPPRLDSDDDKDKVESDTVEDFEARFNKCLALKRPFIYIEDSYDALTEVEEQKASEKNSRAHEKGNATSGTYGTGKARFASRFLRQVKSKIKKNESTLIVISQTRENIGVTFGSKKTRSGGKALKFYATIECWLAVVKTHKDPKYKRPIGSDILMKVSKSKLTGKVRQAETTLWRDYGFDNTTSMINWLCEVNHWKKSSSSINAVDFGVKMQKKALIRYIEDEDLEYDLKMICQKVWDEIEESLNVNKTRKRKYG